MASPKDNPHYVSNKDLYAAYVEWYKEIELAEKEGREEPEIPAYIVDSMIKICTRLTYKPSFINYTYHQDMISDALYDCIRFARRFKATIDKTSCEKCKVSNCASRVNNVGCSRESNPFSYITTIAMNAFFRRIDSEKTQSYVKAKLISELPLHDFFDSMEGDDVEIQESFTQFLLENAHNLENNEPQSIKRKRKSEELLEINEDIEDE